MTLTIRPVRRTPHADAWVRVVEALGGVVTSRDGDRVDLALGHGRVSFEYDGDIRPLAARPTGRGLTASVVDENYGLTLRVPDPDGTGDIYVNQVQTDLHGYRRRNDAVT